MSGPKPFARTKQCAACPWKKSTDPHKDIPGGYDQKRHERLAGCSPYSGRIMACHESIPGAEYACVGWLVNALGQGSHIGMRVAALARRFDPRALVLEGEQHPTLEAMVASGRRPSKGKKP